jgi:hypothetical protein
MQAEAEWFVRGGGIVWKWGGKYDTMLIGFCAVCELGFFSPLHYTDTLTVAKLYARTHTYTHCVYL